MWFTYKIFKASIWIGAFFFPLHQDSKQVDYEKCGNVYQLKRNGKLPEKANESSGLVKVGQDSILTHNDSGGKAELFLCTESGDLLKQIYIEGAKNLDWEDITKDRFGNFYIADVGNNLNERDNLQIYKLNKDFELIGNIKINYADQQRFPPEKDSLNFDCEAIISFGDSLYLFSKNRGHPLVKVYPAPTIPGNYTLKVKDTVFLKGQITAAGINPDSSEYTLLSYGRIYTFGIDSYPDFSYPKSCSYKGRFGQSEGLTYLSNNTILVSNEERKLFRLTRK